MAKSKTTNNWFRYTRKSYLPASWQGLIIYLLYIVYIIIVPVVWYRHGHQLWNFLSEVMPLVIAAVLLTQFIASKNSKSRKN